jgi:hypothetical protein
MKDEGKMKDKGNGKKFSLHTSSFILHPSSFLKEVT